MRNHAAKCIILYLALALSLTIVVMIVSYCHEKEKLSESEQFAMTALPGYFFVFEGTTNYIENARSHRAFVNQHPMMPYLELVTDRLEKRPWARNFPIRVQETDTKIIISEGENNILEYVCLQ